MSAPTPGNDASKPAPSTPKKETEPPHSPTSGGDATTPTANTAYAAYATDPDATPKKAKTDSGDASTSTPSVKHGSITAWGSTSGKLYLSSPRLNDPKSLSGLSEYFLGWGLAKKKKTATEQGGDAEAGETVKGDYGKERSGDVD